MLWKLMLLFLYLILFLRCKGYAIFFLSVLALSKYAFHNLKCSMVSERPKVLIYFTAQLNKYCIIPLTCISSSKNDSNFFRWTLHAYYHNCAFTRQRALSLINIPIWFECFWNIKKISKSHLKLYFRVAKVWIVIYN